MNANGPIASPPGEHVHKSSFWLRHKCDQCSRWRGENARNLIVCIDGTSNEFGQNHTNVVKLFSKINVDLLCPEQYAYYIGGIGTDPKSSHTFSRIGRSLFDKFDMAVGWNVDKIIKEAYRWLAEMYRAGDQIYLFGFSRGAYQARVLAAMIYEVGLTTTSMQKQINSAYAHYRAIFSGKPESGDAAGVFKKLFSWECLPRVHFVGVWDTVSSVGIGRGKNLLSASSSALHACHFRHALALDELRVKFMPEYFREINSLSKYFAEQPKLPEMKSDIKEVWFAGSHADVGGMDRSGSHNSGNASLSWMRGEATAHGLVLRPTDMVWVPDDINFGTSNSMTRTWEIIEYIPITHQVSYSGTGNNSRCLHRLQPRCIIPGQEIHASVRYANKYKPWASLGQGFDIPIVHSGLDMELVSWENMLFDDIAARDLVDHLRHNAGVSPIYFDRLLFVLRFKEGKKCIGQVDKWEKTFRELVKYSGCALFLKLVALVAYYEISCDPVAHSKSPAPHLAEPLSQEFNGLKEVFSTMARKNYRDGARLVSLLRFLTKNEILRNGILEEDAVKTLVGLFDAMINLVGGDFIQAMDGLTCLLQYEGTQTTIIEELGNKCPYSNLPTRLSRVLKVQDVYLLTAALRMVIILAQIPKARTLCLGAKDRINELAEKQKEMVGLLSVKILLALHRPKEQETLNVYNTNVRANLATGTLVRLCQDNYDPTHVKDCSIQVEESVHNLFKIDGDAGRPDWRSSLIKELKTSIQKGNARDRTVATLSLLKLCEIEIIRRLLRETGLLDVFISQLRRKGTALLAAHALVSCLKYDDMRKPIKANALLPKNIVGMLRLDYFDDAVGKIEGFEIFRELMQDDDLRKEIQKHDVFEVVNTRLVKGKSEETRPCLICLAILCAFEEYRDWNEIFVNKSLDYLQSPVRKTQQVGVSILCALARLEHSLDTICSRIPEIVKMLLPDKYLSAIQPTVLGTIPESATDTQMQIPTTLDPWLPDLQMMGPAQRLRQAVRATQHYGALKRLYISAEFVDKKPKYLWRVSTQSHVVMDVLGEMIKIIDEF